jgi:hypothetical protein
MGLINGIPLASWWVCGVRGEGLGGPRRALTAASLLPVFNNPDNLLK